MRHCTYFNMCINKKFLVRIYNATLGGTNMVNIDIIVKVAIVFRQMCFHLWGGIGDTGARGQEGTVKKTKNGYYKTGGVRYLFLFRWTLYAILTSIKSLHDVAESTVYGTVLYHSKITSSHGHPNRKWDCCKPLLLPTPFPPIIGEYGYGVCGRYP